LFVVDEANAAATIARTDLATVVEIDVVSLMGLRTPSRHTRRQRQHKLRRADRQPHWRDRAAGRAFTKSGTVTDATPGP